jgi:hypothetical protein
MKWIRKVCASDLCFNKYIHVLREWSSTRVKKYLAPEEDGT